jgi:ATP phosphoribosyltransferase regulatory subunit
MSAWVLPDHIADVLPSEARHIEELRRDLLDMARCYGYELVMPPLMEHLESLLTGAGQSLDLQTFKLVDQLTGRTLGLRADSTPQVARIDAHLLNRQSVTRLCYCGPVLHTRAEGPHSSREPLQFGAEIYGHAGSEAEREVLMLALDCLTSAKLSAPTVDLADVRIVKSILSHTQLAPEIQRELHAALASKDSAQMASLAKGFDPTVREALLALMQLYGDAKVLNEAKSLLPATPAIEAALSNLAWLSQQIDSTQVSFDLADPGGYAYYSGVRFAIYAQGAGSPVARGGRYDEVGAAFGRKRPAVGFSLDIKTLVEVVEPRPLHPAIRTHWSESPLWSQAVAALRRQGETVVCQLPGHLAEIDEFNFDRELIQVADQWVLKAV